MLGVSRRTISKYEEGEMAASVDVALKLEEILDRGFVVSVDLYKKSHLDNPIHKRDYFEKQLSEILFILKDMGFDVLPASHAPFDAVSISTEQGDRKTTILTGVGEYTSTTIKRAHLMSSISEVALTQALLIVHGSSKTKNIERTVLVEEKELEKYTTSDEFIDLLEERGRKVKVE
jgi:putative transcriptional regulator